MASTCRKLSDAAAELLASPAITLNLCQRDLPASLFSGLAGKWAPTCSRLWLDSHVLAVPSSAAFMALPQRLHTLHVYSIGTPAAAAKFDRFLQSCPGIARLVWTGIHVPCTFPATLRQLELVPECVHALDREDELAEALIIRLSTCGIQLRSLTLCMFRKPNLTCEFLLPELQELHIFFSVCEVPANFAWLRAQPCSRLSLTMSLDAHSWRSCQIQALEKVRQLKLHSLTLRLCASLSNSRLLRSHPFSDCTATVLGFLSQSPHELLPACSRLRFCIEFSDNPLVVHWAALAGQARHVSIVYEGCRWEDHTTHVIQVQGFPGLLPFEQDGAGRPWQFTVLAEVAQVEVRGLPPSLTCTRAAYMLQNKAAAAAGWGDDLDSCK